MTQPLQKDVERLATDFKNWLHGAGGNIFGTIIKSCAQKEKRRLEKALGDEGLFPHIDHETKALIQKADAAVEQGQKMIDRHEKRSAVIETLKKPRP